MDADRASPRLVRFRKCQSIGVALALDRHGRATGSDAIDLHRACHRRHEYLGGDSEPAGSIGDGDPMIPAGRRDYPGLGDGARQKIVERAARLERPGVLEKLQLQREGMTDAECPGSDLHHGRLADVRPYALMRRLDVGGCHRHDSPRSIRVTTTPCGSPKNSSCPSANGISSALSSTARSINRRTDEHARSSATEGDAPPSERPR